MVCDMRNRFWICLFFTGPIFVYAPSVVGLSTASSRSSMLSIRCSTNMRGG